MPTEMENARARWASLTAEQRHAELMRRDPTACPCGAGAVRGHPYAWCMPHPAWLHAAPNGPNELAALLDGAVASLTPNCNPRAMPEALGLLRWLASEVRKAAASAVASATPDGAREREEAAAWFDAEADAAEGAADSFRRLLNDAVYVGEHAHTSAALTRAEASARRNRLAAAALRGSLGQQGGRERELQAALVPFAKAGAAGDRASVWRYDIDGEEWAVASVGRYRLFPSDFQRAARALSTPAPSETVIHLEPGDTSVTVEFGRPEGGEG